MYVYVCIAHHTTENTGEFYYLRGVRGGGINDSDFSF